ncbi:unnamed protein product [Durusdinium trenchii]
MCDLPRDRDADAAKIREHPESCRPCRQFKPELPESCHHGAKCEYCHHPDHKKPKHRSQRGRHNLQKKEFQEKRGSMPLKLTEVIDRIYKVINDEQQKVKKLLKDIDSIDKPFRERVETALLNAINDIGQKAQHLRPDQARLKSCAPIDPVRDGGSEQSQRVEVAHRFKWLSGTLHLVVRKCWSEDRSEDAKMEIIVQHMDVFLGELEKETALLHRRVQQLDLLLADVFLAMCQPDDLQGRIQEVAREDILTNRFDQETLKELCLDAGRLLWQKVDRENKEQMQTATNLKDLLQLVQKDLEQQSKDLLSDEE